MRSQGHDDVETILTAPGPSSGPAPGGRRLAIMGNGESRAIPLPAEGELFVGRASDCAVHIDDVKVSRRHAKLVVGADVTLIDLGSANGTKVGDRLIAPRQPVVIAPGDVMVFGRTIVVLQAHVAQARLRHIWSHGYFESKVEDECARAEQAGRAFAILRVHASPDALDLDACLVDWLRPMDVAAAYSPGEYEFLLLETNAEAAEAIAARVTAMLAKLDPQANVSLACWGRDGRTPEKLLAAASRLHPSEREQPRVQGGALERLRPLVERVAVGTISVLIVGETGVGKEVLANSVHQLSPRAQKPFVAVNCAALSETLLESELFGHEKGAFTGAAQAKPGLLETAQGGTVFFDELGEMSLALQPKVLRVLEKREVCRVGGLRPRAIDVRFVAATNRDLEADVASGRFRQDLYFRLAGIQIVIPPLRERTDEIESLAREFVGHFSTQLGRAKPPRIDAEAFALFKRYAWPGNVRELRNVIERAVLLCNGDVIRLEHLPADKMGRTVADFRAAPPPPPPRSPRPIAPSPPLADEPTFDPWEADTSVESSPKAADKNERKRIVDALEKNAGNQTHAAAMLGISRRTLISRIEQYGLLRPRKR